MNKLVKIWLDVLTMAVMLLPLFSCSESEMDGLQVKLLPSTISGGMEQTILTKADNGYSDFIPYDGLQMEVFATGPNGMVNGKFTYTADGGWDSNVNLEAGKEYNLFVYSPKVDRASFSGNNLLTLSNLSVSTNDVLVVEGVAAQNATVTPGDFSFTMNSNPQGQTPKDYVDLKMDHLFAQLFLEFAIEDPGNDPFKFGNLRKIKITEVELATTTSATATISFNSGNSELPFSVSWSNVQNSDKVYAKINPLDAVQEEDGLMITPEYQQYGGGYVIPTINGTKPEMWLRVKYDVYDLNDTLVREGDVSENKLTVSVQDMVRGTIYKKKIFIQPTYIYSLTDGDLLTLKF